MELQIHPFPPVWDKQSEILILGSFPSVKSREAGFYYGNPHNRFWQMMGVVFKSPVPEDIQGKQAYLLKHHIALWDALVSCEITGSSDSAIRNPIPNDLDKILNTSAIRYVLSNGQVASRFIKKYHPELACEKLIALPSTSPANASWSLQRLVEIWSPALLL